MFEKSWRSNSSSWTAVQPTATLSTCFTLFPSFHSESFSCHISWWPIAFYPIEKPGDLDLDPRSVSSDIVITQYLLKWHQPDLDVRKSLFAIHKNWPPESPKHCSLSSSPPVKRWSSVSVRCLYKSFGMLLLLAAAAGGQFLAAATQEDSSDFHPFPAPTQQSSDFLKLM